MITEGSDNTKDKDSIVRADGALTPPEQANMQVAQGLSQRKCGSEKKLLRARLDY